jgi:hypothetical protein
MLQLVKMKLLFTLGLSSRMDSGDGDKKQKGRFFPDSLGKAPKNTTPWLPLRFNVVDGEDYGRGRIEEYLGDLTVP